MLSKEELRSQLWTKCMEKLRKEGLSPSSLQYGFYFYGVDDCTEILWPEIEALKRNNKELADQRFELMEKVADLERKLHFFVGLVSTQEGFTDKTIDQIIQWAQKEIEGEK